MALFARYLRPWAIVALCLLALPMVVQAIQPSAVISEGEARMLSRAPAWPRTLRDWLALPRNLDRYLGDHFGLRTDLVRAHGLLRYAAHLPSDLRVLIGRDNWLFLNGDGTIEQATGSLLREAEIAKFADRAARLNAWLASRNARLLTQPHTPFAAVHESGPDPTATLVSDRLKLSWPIWKPREILR